ncbi:MAG: hypothetical protein ACRD22_00590 [Terriglobia bacterium]
MTALSTQETVNYLVPSSGRTHAVPVYGVFGAVAYQIDWSQFKNDNFPFQPQGVFIDNSQGSGVLTVEILSNGLNGPVFWQVQCAAGAFKSANFPAPNGQASSITGEGQATVVFVDFPVLPDAGAVVVTGGSVGISGQPISTSPAVNAAGTPYQVQGIPALATAVFNNSITSAVLTSGNIAPGAANQYLRKLSLRLTGNVSLAGAGLEVITATLNGVQIWKGSVYIPAASANVAEYWKEELDFASDGIGLNFGAGDLVVTVGTALATGSLEINVYTG